MLLGMPFVVLARPGFLKDLHAHGFKTFGDFWDESYDDCYDYRERYEHYYNTLKQIQSFSVSKRKAMLNDMQPILEHNNQLCLSGWPIYSCLRTVENFIETCNDSVVKETLI